MTQEEIIKQQDEIIGRLTRENEYLETSYRLRKEWLSNAKKEAGFEDAESFDNVWKTVLESYLKNK